MSKNSDESSPLGIVLIVGGLLLTFVAWRISKAMNLPIGIMVGAFLGSFAAIGACAGLAYASRKEIIPVQVPILPTVPIALFFVVLSWMPAINHWAEANHDAQFFSDGSSQNSFFSQPQEVKMPWYGEPWGKALLLMAPGLLYFHPKFRGR